MLSGDILMFSCERNTRALCFRNSVCVLLSAFICVHQHPVIRSSSKKQPHNHTTTTTSPAPDLLTVSPVLNPWSFQRVLMFHGSLSGCERNTPAHVTPSFRSLVLFSGQQPLWSGCFQSYRVVFFVRRGRHPQMWFVHKI